MTHPPQIAADKVEELSFQEEAEVKCHNSESKTGIADKSVIVLHVMFSDKSVIVLHVMFSS